MIIGSDPFRFSVMIEPVNAWSDSTYCNGVMLISVDGYMFPHKELLNITLDCLSWGFLDKLKNIPKNDELFAVKSKRAAFREIYSRAYPDDPDVDRTRSFVISPEELLDKRYLIFAVSSGENVRILAARPAYDTENSRYLTENVTVRETYVTKAYFDEMIRQTADFLNNLNGRQ